MTFTIVVQPAHGILSGTAPHLIYSPARDYTGYDSFAFKVNDGHGDSMSATVFISVQESTSTPAVVIMSPTSGTVVRGQLFVKAFTVDDVRTVSAVLYIDSVIHARLLGVQPYQFAVDTTKLNNGSHALVVRTYDIDNNEAISPQVNIVTENLIQEFSFVGSAATPAFTPDDDGQDDTIGFTANLSENANWTLRIRRRGSTDIIRQITGSGTSVATSWDGTDDNGFIVPMGIYEYSLSACATSPGGQQVSQDQETQWRQMWVAKRAPNWNNVNYHAYNSYVPNHLAVWLATYFFAYLGLAPLTFMPDPEVYLYEVQLWCTLLGYDGYIVNHFTEGEFLSRISSDNVVYVIAHGAYSPEAHTTIFVDVDDNSIGAYQIGQAWEKHTHGGFLFVQVNCCQSGDGTDADGNNDLAAGFGIFTTPMTYGRAYLGWRGKIYPTMTGLYAFDQYLWGALHDQMTVQEAVTYAWAASSWFGGEPVIVGDPDTTLPDLFWGW